ncbi:hypothetical protein CXF72_04390 [Psychromonas sp. MB-3u-54]|uniref:SO_0444 family Cu/Zn efflux transporter n=1 Tax=Psychromonas sp. MB-3u-54 TaxID=2058319 RepID=UPI000C33FF51|nr:SO_0444 family Cu/Zn efflux transporter [Psychromonas sp. MB-3u-54]PKH03818.1 hypothetical protein CXF72_04390 [Psychromonas sp. MB-3u-54]
MLLIHFIDLFLDSAPWLLLGLIFAGMLKMFVPMKWIHNQLGGHGFKSTIKAALIGAPLPLCSCGVIPAAVGLRRSGASKAATTSFLVSTPETGIDSITVSYVLLGPFMAIVRPIAAITSAIVAGLLVGKDDPQKETEKTDNSAPKKRSKEVNKTTCCTGKTPVIKAVHASCCTGTAPLQTKTAQYCESTQDITPGGTDTKPCCESTQDTAPDTAECCQSTQDTTPKQTDTAECCQSTQDIATQLQGTSIIGRVLKGVHFAATDLVKDITVWLLIGLFFAALVQTYVPADFLVRWGDGILAMLVMVIISVPMYICATASTPIAAGLLLAGVSPGAVLVFMLAGPATNIATLGVVAKELGKRALWGYLGGVLSVALISGILVNYLVSTFGILVTPQIGEQHQLLPEIVVNLSAIILAILMAKVLYNMLPKKLKQKNCCS